MKSQFLFLLLLWIVIFSCKKDDDTRITYPSAYHKSGIKTAGALRVFSSNGEIRDPAIVSSFNDKDSFNFSSVAGSIGSYPGTIDSIRLPDAQHAIVHDKYVSSGCGLTHENGKMILTRNDISTGGSYGDEFTRSPAYYVGQFKPDVYDEYLVSSTRGYYQFGYTTREKFVVEKSGGQLVAPLVLFTLHRNQGESSGYINNILQKDFYKNISVGDTLTLKEYQILYEK